MRRDRENKQLKDGESEEREFRETERMRRDRENVERRRE